MSLLDTASLVVTPNGTKASKLYSVVPSSGAGDLDVTRATTATRVNSAGLIESVASNVPRLDYTNGSCPSVLVEPQRTNTCIYGQDFSSNWFKGNVTTTANSGTSPLGTNTATKYLCTANGAYIYQSIATSGVTTVSCFIKKSNADWVYFATNVSGVGDYGASFNINNGTVGTIVGGATCSIENYGNGWYRCIVTKDYSGAIILLSINPLSGNNDFTNQNGKEYLIWGAQLEAGSYATSYIPTTSASVTRNADVINKTGISSLIGQTEGVIYLDIDFNSVNQTGSVDTLVMLNNDSNNNEIAILLENAGSGKTPLALISNSGSFQSIIYAPYQITATRYKIAIAYKNNDIAFYINGSLVGTDTSATIPTTSSINLKNRFDGSWSNTQQEYINLSALWKTRLTNTQLAQLTTI
jgi:hypothetical protein